MTGSASFRHGKQTNSLKRRRLLGLLASAPLSLTGLLLAACSGTDSIPPRQYKRPRSHITGGIGGGR